MHFPWRLSALALLTLHVATVSVTGEGAPTASVLRKPVAVKLKPVRDPFPPARPRYWDIANQPFTAFITHHDFSYANAQATLTYDAAPPVPYFVGHLTATGLKPNFAYQLKLVGKPVGGSRGWGVYGDNLANVRIGAVGRWWCDTEQKNVPDSHYDTYYLLAPTNRRHSVDGYLFMGSVLTDEFGKVDADFTGRYSYHIDWQDWQDGFKDVEHGTFSVQSTVAPYYGYGAPVAPRRVTLWYELEAQRRQPVRLPAGSYNCRFVLEEESFHNLLGGTADNLGGYWLSVLGNEDFDAHNRPDTDRGNDVVFTIR